MRYRTVILVMLLISSLVSITGSAANTVRTDIDERLLAEYPVDYFDLELDLPVTEYICGYSLDRQTRGDCDSNDAPGELWFKFTIPNNSIGDVFKFEIVNKDEPHYVDLSVNVCKGNEYFIEQLVCTIKDDMYTNTEQDFTVSPVVSSHYFLHILAWDEEKEQRSAGGDLTQVEIKISRIGNSNLDNSEPVDISNLTDFGLTFEDNVCAVGCDEGDSDAFDIYTVFGIKGDLIQLQFGSNEGDVNSDFGLEVNLQHETDFFEPNFDLTSYVLDDSYEYSDIETTNSGVTLLNYTWEKSGVIYLRFHSTIGDDSFAGEEIEDYWFTISNLDISNRNYSVDLDLDGLPDAMEYQCASDLRVASDTALDTDSDKVCDLFDDDDDNDGMLDDEEFRCDSDPKDVNSTAPDYDNDGVCNEFDLDDDNDGMSDQEEIRCGSDYRNSSDIADDNDSDGVCDEFDLDDDNDGMLDSMENLCGSDPNSSISIAPDYDDDGQCDDIDDDDDGDGRTDEVELACSTNPYNPFDSLMFDDFDWDGICDRVDDDDDDDGVLDSIDFCNDTYWEDVFDQTDSDGDGCFYEEDPCPNIFGISLREGCGGAFDVQNTENSVESDNWLKSLGQVALDIVILFIGIVGLFILLFAGTMLFGNPRKPGGNLIDKISNMVYSVLIYSANTSIRLVHGLGSAASTITKMVRGLGGAASNTTTRMLSGLSNAASRKSHKARKKVNKNTPSQRKTMKQNHFDLNQKIANARNLPNKQTPITTQVLDDKALNTNDSKVNIFDDVQWNESNAKQFTPSDEIQNQVTQILENTEVVSADIMNSTDIVAKKGLKQIKTGLSIVNIDMIEQTVTKIPRTEENYEMFKKEIDNLVKLKEKGIKVNLLDYENKPIPKIVLRLRGTNKLTDIIGECNNTVKQKIIIDLINFMVSIHHAGFVHRDLKPDNIMVDKHPKGDHSFETIIDFGISMKINSRQKDRFNTAGTPFFSHKSQQNEQFNAATGQDWFSMARIIALIIRGTDTSTLEAEINMSENGLDIKNEIQHIGFDDKQTSFIQNIVSIATDKNCNENTAVHDLTKVGKSLPSFKSS